jgi:hypothetical protein
MGDLRAEVAPGDADLAQALEHAYRVTVIHDEAPVPALNPVAGR